MEQRKGWKSIFSLRCLRPPLEHDAVREAYRCWAEVDLGALRENLAQIRDLAGPEKKVITVVKADAYGHGLRPIAATLMQGGSDLFGVANLAEARAIRSVGRGWPILMLGACLPFEVEAAVRDQIMPAISSFDEAERFSQEARRQKAEVSVHLKVDTGMGRLGVPPEAVAPLVKAAAGLPGIRLKGIFTHYSSAEDDQGFTETQRTRFVSLVKDLHERGHSFEWIHASNSGGVLLESDQVCNTVRPGLLVYGIIPPGKRPVASAIRSRFRPALTWKCRVSFVKSVPSGTPISYGHTHITGSPRRLATITAGYGDGYFRSASNRAQVLIGSCRCPVVGRVTMDQVIADISEVPAVQPGDEVILLGRQGQEEITVSELADWCSTVPWEILTNITYRVPRIYRGSQAA